MKPSPALILAAGLLLAAPGAACAKAKTPAPASTPAMQVPATGQAEIAASVGSDAISTIDVNDRIKFIIVTAHLSGTPDVIERIRPQVIRSLVDEKLQMQEAKKNDIKVDDKDVAGAVATIENQRGMPPGTIFHILDENHVPHATFTNQIRAQIGWNRLIGKKLRPDIKISDEEVALAKKKFSEAPPVAAPKPHARITQVQIAVLVLPVEKTSREAEMRKLAEKLAGEIHNGASFEEVSRQFSGSSPKENGKIARFWVDAGELDPAIARSLTRAEPGMVTEPVRTEQGYTMVKVYDVKAEENAGPSANSEPAKDQEVTLKQILLKLKGNAGRKEAEILLQIGQDVAKNPGTCKDKGVANIENLQDFDISVDFRHGLLSEMPAGLRTITEGLKVGESSQPFASNEGIRLFMLCEEQEAGTRQLDPAQVKDQLFREKLELAAQKYMRDLRREAYVDVR